MFFFLRRVLKKIGLAKICFDLFIIQIQNFFCLFHGLDHKNA